MKQAELAEEAAHLEAERRKLDDLREENRRDEHILSSAKNRNDNHHNDRR